MISSVPPDAAPQSVIEHATATERSSKAEEIAFTALFLASDVLSYITGTDIVVDGGWFSSALYLTNERSHHMPARPRPGQG
jgi:NAD(P)-dependent dehydrogenase (short-subunit alcohol dehydrogenase family)